MPNATESGRRLSGRLVVAGLTAAFVLLAPMSPAEAASAKDVAKARKLAERAALAVKEGRPAEAIELYEQAYELGGDSGLLLTLGRMLRAEGELLMEPGAKPEALVKARELYLRGKGHLVKSTEVAPDAIIRAEVDILIEDIEAKLERVAELLAPTATGPVSSRFGRLTITSSVDNATVLVDGIKRGKTPLELEGIEAGEHVVAVARLGFNPFNAPVSVKAEETLAVHAELSPLTPLEVPGGSSVGSGVGLGGTSAGLDGGSTGTGRGSSGIVGKWWFWTAIGGVVVAGAIASALVIVNSGAPPLPDGVILTFGDVRPVFRD